MGLLTSSSPFPVRFDAFPLFNYSTGGLDVHTVFLLNELLFYNLNSLIYLLYKVDTFQWTPCSDCRIVFIDVGGRTLYVRVSVSLVSLAYIGRRHLVFLSLSSSYCKLMLAQMIYLIMHYYLWRALV